MAIVEILQLVSILREVASKKSELDKNYFETFIQPLWSLFSAVHKNYITSVKSYSDKICDVEYPIDKLLEDIHSDSVYTQDLRTELQSMSRNTPFARYAVKKDEIQELLDSIDDYFDIQRGLHITLGKELETLEILYDLHPKDFIMNVIRAPLLIYLSLNMNQIQEQKSPFPYIQVSATIRGDRTEAKKVFDNMGGDLQVRYKKVSDSYYSLRKNTLK